MEIHHGATVKSMHSPSPQTLGSGYLSVKEHNGKRSLVLSAQKTDADKLRYKIGSAVKTSKEYPDLLVMAGLTALGHSIAKFGISVLTGTNYRYIPIQNPSAAEFMRKWKNAELNCLFEEDIYWHMEIDKIDHMYYIGQNTIILTTYGNLEFELCFTGQSAANAFYDDFYCTLKQDFPNKWK